VRAFWIAGSVVALLAGATLCTAAVDDKLTLGAEAGLGGAVRLGRSVPVRVSIENKGTDLSGELVLTWGPTTVRRSVTLAAPSSRQVELYISSDDPREVMTLQLVSGGATLRSVEMPVRVLPDSPVTLCVVTSTAVPIPDELDETCTLSVTTDRLPRAMRGYEAADHVLWRAGPEASLAADERTALARWRAHSALEEANVLASAPRITPPSPEPETFPLALPVVAGTLGVYLVAAAMVFTVLAGPSGRRPHTAYVALLLVVAAAAAWSAVAGRFGPRSALRVAHRTTVYQLPDGTSRASMRAVAESPSFDVLRLRAVVAEGLLVTTPSDGAEAAQRFDEDGYPALSDTFGLGATREFRVDGIVDKHWLTVTRRDDVVRAANTSPHDLFDCRFPDRFSPERVGTLPAGQAIDARDPGGRDHRFLTCSLADRPFELLETRYRVEVEGESLVTALVPPWNSTPAAVAP
jgi:hypothetical protein